MLAHMSVLQFNVLVFQQTRNFSKNDFAISEPNGTQVAHVETGGSTLGRMLGGARELTVFDGPGRPVLRVYDTMTLGRERMEFQDTDGNPIGNLVKRISLFKTKIDLEVLGEQLQLDGNLWGFDFNINSPQGPIAGVSREWSGMSNALFGKSTYSLRLAEWASVPQRLGIIGGVLALDLIREKQERNNG